MFTKDFYARLFLECITLNSEKLKITEMSDDSEMVKCIMEEYVQP